MEHFVQFCVCDTASVNPLKGENMTLKTLLMPLLVISTTATAGPLVVGDYMEKTPVQTCKITTKSGGTCSGTMVSNQFMISARHCFGLDTKENTTISCDINGKKYTSGIAGLKLSKDIYDAAVVKLKTKMPLSGMKLLKDTKSYVKSSSLSRSTCAVVGYGVNNSGTTGVKNGVYLDNLAPSMTYFETVHLPAILDNRLVEIFPGYYSTRQIQVATEGGAVPLVGEVYNFIKSSIRSLGGSSKTISLTSK